MPIKSEGVAGWAEWRKLNPTVQQILNNADLSDQNLDGIDLRGAQANGIDFQGSSLVNANLESMVGKKADFSNADLSGAIIRNADLPDARFEWARLLGVDCQNSNLTKARLQWANLETANLHRVVLVEADLRRASLAGTNARRADLSEADAHRSNFDRAVLCLTRMERTILRQSSLIKADLEDAYLKGADLRNSDLSGANLKGTDLRYALLIKTKLDSAKLIDCRVYGLAAWGLDTSGSIQSDINIGHPKEPSIYVDNLDVAQLLHLFVTNKKIRNIINSTSAKVVLILGRFTSERKTVLEKLRTSLLQHDYIPVLFDFEKPTSRDFTETVSALTHLSNFVIADITDPRSIHQELMRIVPMLPSVPVQPIMQSGSDQYGMFGDLLRYPWVLPLYRYRTTADAIADLQTKIIEPAEAKARETRLAAGDQNAGRDSALAVLASASAA